VPLRRTLLPAATVVTLTILAGCLRGGPAVGQRCTSERR
jgi:hypothetical protein